MVNSGFEFPLRRITVNLAPAYLRKVGPAFDLPLAVALLVASEQLEPEAIEACAVVGELSLTGEVRPIRGALAVAEGVRRARAARGSCCRARGRARPRWCRTSRSSASSRCSELVATLRGDARAAAAARRCRRTLGEPEADLADVRGHNGLDPRARGRRGRRAQPVPAGAAGHRQDDDRAAAAVDPAAARARRGDRGHAHPVDRRPARRRAGLVTARPFRAPHHTVSAAGLVGGANPPQPGEATLAHRGVLFLDELSEFARPSLEALRQPLEDGHVTIVRGQQVMVFPTRFMLVAASNPCPCGLGGTRCQCSQADLARHRRRLSGPLLDRIDILMRVERPPAEALRRQIAPDAPPTVRERVVAARERQTAPARRPAGDLQRPAHLAPDPRGRPGHPERPAPARRALRPPHALRPRPHPHPARRPHRRRPRRLRRRRPRARRRRGEPAPRRRHHSRRRHDARTTVADDGRARGAGRRTRRA